MHSTVCIGMLIVQVHVCMVARSGAWSHAVLTRPHAEHAARFGAALVAAILTSTLGICSEPVALLMP